MADMRVTSYKLHQSQIRNRIVQPESAVLADASRKQQSLFRPITAVNNYKKFD